MSIRFVFIKKPRAYSCSFLLCGSTKNTLLIPGKAVLSVLYFFAKASPNLYLC